MLRKFQNEKIRGTGGGRRRKTCRPSPPNKTKTRGKNIGYESAFGGRGGNLAKKKLHLRKTLGEPHSKRRKPKKKKTPHPVGRPPVSRVRGISAKQGKIIVTKEKKKTIQGGRAEAQELKGVKTGTCPP